MFFWNQLEQFADKIAVTEENQNYTYAELLRTADTLAEHVPVRSVVFLECENCFEAIAAYVGFLRRRAVIVLINNKISPEMLENLKNSYQPAYLCCRIGWNTKGRNIHQFGQYQILQTDCEKKYPINEDLAVLITTSGSTGSAKLVMQSYENIQANTESIITYLGISAQDRAITTMPMSYTYGLSIIQTHLCAGACIIATERTLMEQEFWKILKAQKATTFGGVPYLYEMLKRLRFSRMELPSLRYLTQAGGRLSPELVQEFVEVCKAKDIQFIVMYGQTEATARMSYLPWKYASEKAGSIGIAIPGGEFSLTDESGNLITEPDTVGELVYYGKNVTLGYALSAEDFQKSDQFGGVLRTGDMAKFDNDGFFYIAGRKKRFLKLFGNRVNLDETETILRKAGFEAICGGSDDLLKLYLVNADEVTLSSAVDFISGQTGLNRSAFAAFAVPEIPRSDSGKIQYTKLEELYG